MLSDRVLSSFVRGCDLCDDIGVWQTICYDTTTEPTEEYIEKMINKMNSTKNEKSLRKYYSLVEHIRTEVIEDEKI